MLNRVLKNTKIYTRTGDKGTTTLFTGQRISKHHPIFEVLGNVDLLSSSMGIAREQATSIPNLPEQILYIQSRLQDLNAHIATPRTDKTPPKVLSRTTFTYDNVELLENWIDEMDKDLKPLTKFILPSGGIATTQLHLSRAFCRTAERRCVELFELDTNYDDAAKKFLNRLSDYLFTAARFATIKNGNFDEEYVAKK